MSIIDTTVDKDLRDLISDLFTQAVDGEETWDATWANLRETGLARLTGDEEHGGSGAGWGEAAALLTGAARAGAPVPYAETDLIAGRLLADAGVASDDAVRTLALVDDSGAAQCVAWAREATAFAVLGRRGGSWVVADVPADAATVTDYPAPGREPRANVSFDPSVLDGAGEVPESAVAALVLRGALARCLQTVAALETACDLAREYVVTRHQFGRPLAKFQSVQNLVVDAVAETTLARSAVDEALADAMETDLAGELSAFRVAVAKSVVGRAASVAVRNAHQALGAIGTTEEHSLHRFTNAALTWRAEFGAIRTWEEAIGAAAASGDVDAVWAFVVQGAAVDAPLPAR